MPTNDSLKNVKKNLSFSEILTLVLIASVTIVLLVLLFIWSNYIENNQKIETLKEAISDVIEICGEKALLEMVGIPVDEISYSEEHIPLFTEDTPSWNYLDKEVRNIAIYDKAKSSVVQIQTLSELSDSGQGSGVVITPDGYIVTNKHVIGSGNTFNVNFYDGSTKMAKLIGYDSLTDIALIKVDGKNLDFIEIGTSTSLTVGQNVWAIGNPFGYTWSFTTGMISGLERMVFTSDGNVIPNMIQTDAMINPGNSGGPLLDSNGKMIGLISSIYSTSGTAQGISFALPIEVVKDVVSQIIEYGTVQRGWLDILSVELNAQIVSYSSLPVKSGILISQVVPAGKADRAGLKGGGEKAQYGQSVIYLGGDIITELNGYKIDSYVDYFAALFSTKPGDKVEITVNRKGESITIKDVELIKQTEENTKWILR